MASSVLDKSPENRILDVCGHGTYHPWDFRGKTLGVFSGPPLSVFNVGVAVYLFLGIALTVPFFLLADWNREEPKIRSVPTIFNPDFIIDND